MQSRKESLIFLNSIRFSEAEQNLIKQATEIEQIPRHWLLRKAVLGYVKEVIANTDSTSPVTVVK